MIGSDVSSYSRNDRAKRVRKAVQHTLKQGSPISAIRDVHAAIKGCNPSELRQHVVRLQQFVRRGQDITSDEVLSLGGAVVCEAIRQVKGKNLYDVQLHAGVVLALGAVAEMATGEGKTLSGLFPAFLHALKGRGVHVATPNTYLATRDHAALEPILNHLGMRAGLLTEDNDQSIRSQAYACEITYGPGYGFGFDYLRDQLTLRSQTGGRLGQRIIERLHGSAPGRGTMQRGRHYVILDEIDHVLIDDAMSPLVLSSAGDGDAPDARIHREANEVGQQLTAIQHFELTAGGTDLHLTPEGIEQLYDVSTCAQDAELRRAWHEYVTLALRARYLFRRDVNYIVDDGAIRIIDGTTGRIFDDRSWNDGQHQAVEAKEGVRITEERVPLARITRQRFYRMYDCLAGMTGTASGCEQELARVYGLPVQPIPLRVESRRITMPTIVARDQDEKAKQIETDVARCVEKNQPVLVGTLNISESERIAEDLTESGMRITLLNGKQDEEEASIVAAAGAPGVVTIATNMAGRGTDIHIGEQSANAGGLHVVVAEFHALSRVDRQLIGRAARQGDPGSVRCFLALDDPIVRTSAPWIVRWLHRNLERGTIDQRQLDRMIARVQASNQRRQSQIRLQMLRQDLAQQKLVAPKTTSANINVQAA